MTNDSKPCSGYTSSTSFAAAADLPGAAARTDAAAGADLDPVATTLTGRLERPAPVAGLGLVLVLVAGLVQDLVVQADHRAAVSACRRMPRRPMRHQSTARQ